MANELNERANSIGGLLNQRALVILLDVLRQRVTTAFEWRNLRHSGWARPFGDGREHGGGYSDRTDARCTCEQPAPGQRAAGFRARGIILNL